MSPSSKIDRVSFVVFVAVLFLTPIFFIPSLSVPFQTGKTAFILYGITIAFGLWCIARLRDGVYEVPKNLLTLAAGILALVYTLAALFSSNQGASLSGLGFELGTLSFFLPSIVLFLLIPLIVRSQKDIFYSYMALLAAFVLLGLYHVIRIIFGADTLSFGLLTSATSNLIGKWNDLGIFFGLGTLISFITLDRGQISGLSKALVYALLVLSLVMLVVVNFSAVWITLAILSLVYFIYELSFGKKGSYLGARMPHHTLIVLVLSVIFIFAGSKIGGAVSNSLGISQLEVRPSWGATWNIAESTLKEDPIFGIGPNRFSNEWLRAKPDGINNTLFWNVDFNYGIGFIPSFLTTVGLLGFLAILFFVGLFLVKSVKALFRETGAPFSRYLVLSSLFGSVYLWIFSVLYVPSSALWILTLALSGLFVASLREEGGIKMAKLSVVERPAASFVSVLFTILLLIGTVSFGYFVTVKLIGSTYFQRAVLMANTTGDLDKSATLLGSALSLSPTDVYYQSLSEIYLGKVSQVLNDSKLSQTDAQAQFQNYLSGAIQAAQEAVRLDTSNYRNHLALGRVFEAVVPLNIEGAYESAKKSYEDALALNPESPEIYLILARLEVANEDNDAAKAHIAKAIEKKGDYADAIFLLSQIQIAENDVPNAIRSVEAVATLSPSDPGIFFQLGILYYNQKDYATAVLALERAISLNPQYANAKYFLGLAYYEVKEKEKALQQFEELAVTNPDNEEIEAIIANLKAGKAPLVNQTPPQQRTAAPVSESTMREEI